MKGSFSTDDSRQRPGFPCILLRHLGGRLKPNTALRGGVIASRPTPAQLELLARVGAAQKRGRRRSNPRFPGVPGPPPPPDGRKTVCQSPPACHKKYWPHRETSVRETQFHFLPQRTNPKEPHMSDTQTEQGHSHAGSHNGPAKAVSQLSESMAQTVESQRALIQEMTLFAREEGIRFVNLRLERNGHALDKLQSCQGIPGLIGVQQEWLR